MRNLKKFLALVLAFMMTMSLMVTVNASNVEKAPDAENVTAFEEAIDVLMGMGILRGGDNNAINPKSNITRAEMAAFIYRLYTGDVDGSKEFLYAETATGFSDVDMGLWYAGPIGFCASNKFITGSEGMFRPLDNITGYEALVMVLRAMGYDKEEREMTGNPEWKQIAHTRALTVGLLNGVNSANYSYSLIQPATREFVAELIFRAANLPMVTYNRGFINKYEYMNAATGVENQTLGQWQFGLTSNTGVIVGNQATGENCTKIGFSVTLEGVDNEPNGSWDYVTGGYINNRLTSPTGTTLASPYHYSTTNSTHSADDLVKEGANVTLSFVDNKATDFITDLKTAQTDLSLFNHKVKVWYDNRSTNSVAVTASSNAGRVSFPTNVATYTIRDEAVDAAVIWDYSDANTNPDIGSAFAAGNPVQNLSEVLSLEGYRVSDQATTNKAYFNYAFSPMNNDNYEDDASTAKSAVSPMKMNDENGSGGTNYPLYLVISNSSTAGKPNVDVIISLDMTVTQIIEDNKYQKTESFGVLNSNDKDYNETTNAGNSNVYFGDVVGGSVLTGTSNVVRYNTTTNGGSYLNIPRAHLLSTDANKLGKGDYVSVVAIAGTDGGVGTSSNTRGTLDAIASADGTNIGKHNNGNAPRIVAGSKYDLSDNEFYYQINTVTEKIAGVVKYIAPDQTVTIEKADGTRTDIPKSIFAETTDASFAGSATRGVNDVQKNENYYFYLDQAGEYLFYEKDPNANTKFVYGTYMDWQTSWLSAQFDYGLVFIDSAGEQDSSKVYTIDNRLTTPAVTTTTGIPIQGILGDNLLYATVQLPKREDPTGSAYSSSATVAGVYVGYVLDGDGNLKAITDKLDYDTGFFQATENDFGHGANRGADAGNHIIKITSSDVKVGAKEIGDDNNKLALTKDTEFYLVSGTGSGDAKAKKVYMSDLQDCEISAYDESIGFINNSNNNATHRYLLDGIDNPTGLNDIANDNELWKMVYYSIDESNTYAQLVQGGAKPVAKVFLPEACVKGAAAAATGTQLIFVGDASKAVDKKNSTTLDKNAATLFNVYEASTGDLKQVWIKGYFDDSAANDAQTVYDPSDPAASDNTFYKLRPTTEKTNDEETIYELMALSDSDKNRVVGMYWDPTASSRVPSNNDSSGTYASGLFIPAYYGGESYGYIRDNAGTDHLVNIAGAKVVNLNETKYPVMNNPHDLLYAASVDVNKAVDNVSYYTSALSIVAVVYIDA